MRNTCHLCGGKLFPQPVLQLRGMPKAAQYYPKKSEFRKDLGITLVISQCKNCGLVQHNAKPVDYFKKVITAASLSKKSRQSRLDQMKNLSDKFRLKNKKVLDIGSGKEMLDVLKEAGMFSKGIEGDIVGGSKIKNRPFDAFISLNYLEHLPYPGRVINNIYENTTADSVGFVTVPNLDYLLKTKCFYEFVADHISYFTQKTLKYAFESNGFDVLECQPINNDNDIAVTVKKRADLKLAEEYGAVDSLINDFKDIVREYKSKNKKIAVWGAGHRTLALLALAGLKDIEYVVDSAKFKQGKFTPVTHFKIVSPEYLLKNKVDLVIVMVPGIYPGEVLKTLQEMGAGAKIATLIDNKIKFI